MSIQVPIYGNNLTTPVRIHSKYDMERWHREDKGNQFSKHVAADIVKVNKRNVKHYHST